MSRMGVADISLLRNPKLIMFIRNNKLSEMEVLDLLLSCGHTLLNMVREEEKYLKLQLCKELIWSGKDLLNPMIKAGFIDKKKSDILFMTGMINTTS